VNRQYTQFVKDHPDVHDVLLGWRPSGEAPIRDDELEPLREYAPETYEVAKCFREQSLAQDQPLREMGRCQLVERLVQLPSDVRYSSHEHTIHQPL
jgi:hypothetical protein